MKTGADWIEIPVTDMDRAAAFYETILGVTLTRFNPGDVLQMALFPVEPGGTGMALCKHPQFYQPGHCGALVYIHAEPDLAEVLARVEAAGGKIIIPKRMISEQNGYMALFEDCEGNRMALHSSG